MASVDIHKLKPGDEDVTDAIPSDAIGSNLSSGGSQLISTSVEGTPDAPSSEDSGFASASLVLPVHNIAAVPRYEMNRGKRGICVVICNSRFKEELGLPDRNGCEKDIEALKETFEHGIAFEWTCLRNLTTLEMYQAMILESRKDYSDYGCFMVAILTHGVKGEVYGTDGSITIDKLVEPLKMCSSLVGKPKIVIIQACRGKNVDRGVTLERDDDDPQSSTETALAIPAEADFLYAYSTADGYVAFNNAKNGSWFVQALCAEFKQNFRELEVLQMLTRVCHKIAYEHASYTPSRPETHNLKQVSSVTTTLTKALYFI